MPHLLLAVSAHGYGHLAQSAPVIEALTQRIPGLQVTLQGDIDPAFARHRLPAGFTHLQEATDPVLLMDGPLITRWAESLVEYNRFEAEYDRHLERQMDSLRRLAPDLVLSDIPWLPLDAARRLGIPAVGLCSLSWYDILRECPVRAQVPTALLERMRRIYGAADLFIRPAPAMPMDWLPNARDVGPIAHCRPNQSAKLREHLGIPADRPLALMQFGGFAGFDPLTAWPEQDQVHWVVRDLGGRARGDASSLSDHRLDLLDLLGSFDLMLTKPGYGSYTEAACNGVPVIHVPRPDWPEEPALNRWIRRQVPTRELSLADLKAGRLAAPIAELLAAGRPAPVEPSGITASVELLEPLLRD
ncbi:hypothetical protein [uncultured Lamprocystis sp.]|uniref:hypothetical protein n=1 Tax=uncultured Lamprocystis sp. TaxID=543132 RepID=UPI0025E63769|nr:hypothetical protein [uncultured Lamprocystis sp.]